MYFKRRGVTTEYNWLAWYPIWLSDKHQWAWLERVRKVYVPWVGSSGGMYKYYNDQNSTYTGD
jgi:hypothetical protein